jgi:uncharacterized protein (TIGR02246 family)
VASPAEVYQALREAHAKADADAAAALYASDAVYYEPDSEAHRGRDDIRTYLAAYFARRGPVEVTVKREVFADSAVLAEWTSSYTEEGRRWSGTPGARGAGRHGPPGLARAEADPLVAVLVAELDVGEPVDRDPDPASLVVDQPQHAGAKGEGVLHGLGDLVG